MADFTLPTAMTLNAWHHVALVRNAGTTYVYVDGVRATGSTATALTIWPTKLRFGTGWYGSLPKYSLNGMLDDIRVTGGVARYTAATYAIPTFEFSNN
jgi:hypothetical protein